MREMNTEYMYKETSCQIRMNMHLTYETGISFVLYNASRVSNKKVKSGLRQKTCLCFTLAAMLL